MSAMTAYAPLRALFSEAGYVFVEPPILHDANVFVELAGEDLRRRLFLTRRPTAPRWRFGPTTPSPSACITSPRGRRGGAPATPISARSFASAATRRTNSSRPASNPSDAPTGSRPTPTSSQLALAAVDCLGVAQAVGPDRRLGPVRRPARRSRPQRAVAAPARPHLRRRRSG